jgi:sortase A
MRDRRPVDELSIEELERILVIRKREARQQRLRRYETQGRRVAMPEVPLPSEIQPDEDAEPEPEIVPQQHEAAAEVEPLEPPVTYDITDDVPRFEDDPDPEPEPLVRRTRRKPQAVPLGSPDSGEVRARRRSAFDRVLMAVEVVGVLGILVVIGIGVYLVLIENNKIDELQQKSAEIQQGAEAMRPTPSPAPDLRVSSYVLPSGHYSPDETNGVAVFNYDEVPESVRPAVAAQINAPQSALPTPSANSPAPAQIEIPAIGVNASVYQGDDWYTLQKGVGHLPGSGSPGDGQNMVLSAHNDIFGELFRYLENLEPGDEIIITSRNGQRYTYTVREKQIVDPDDVWVLGGDVADITLITCHPYRVDNKRMIVFGELSSAS